MDDSERVPVLDCLSGIAPLAAEDIKDHPSGFLPLPVHELALRIDKVVVLGTRGAGKSALFRLLLELDGRVPGLFGVAPNSRETRWIDAFSVSLTHPQPVELDALAGEENDEGLRLFWMAHLLRTIGLTVPEVSDGLPAFGVEHLTTRALVQATRANIGQLTASLDAIERRLRQTNLVVVAAYDQIDLLGLHDARKRQRLASTLLALWQSLSVRYQRIRAKIFLRPDIFEDCRRSSTDVSKLSDHAVSLAWDPESIFRMAVRRLANATNASGRDQQVARDWLRSRALVSLEDRGDLGWMPGPMEEAQQKSFSAALVGEWMGSGPTKGASHRWLWNHLQDGNGQVVPRSILSLLRYASERARGRMQDSADTLLRPPDLVGALVETSRDRVIELLQDFKIVVRLENLTGLLVPMNEEEMKERLSQPRPGETEMFPQDGAQIIDELVRLGVLWRREDGRFDVPDIYRHGYDIKRKGGAARFP